MIRKFLVAFSEDGPLFSLGAKYNSTRGTLDLISFDGCPVKDEAVAPPLNLSDFFYIEEIA